MSATQNRIRAWVRVQRRFSLLTISNSLSQSLNFEFDRTKPKSPQSVCFCAVLAVRAFLGRQRIWFGFGGRTGQEKRPRFTGQFASLRSSWGFERKERQQKEDCLIEGRGAFSRRRICNDAGQPNTTMNWVLLLVGAAMAAGAAAQFQTGPCANTPQGRIV